MTKDREIATRINNAGNNDEVLQARREIMNAYDRGTLTFEDAAALHALATMRCRRLGGIA